jgi:diketogulonate reductase-like aldo/keto reductase
MLAALGIKYFDLLLIHWPGPGNEKLLAGSPTDLEKACSWKFFTEHIKAAWTNMLSLKKSGKVCESVPFF